MHHKKLFYKVRIFYDALNNFQPKHYQLNKDTMKPFSINILVVLIFIFGISNRLLAQENDADAASEYYKKAIELKQQYKLDSADYYLKKAAMLFKKNEDWDNYLIVQNEVGSILLAKNEFDKAISFFQEQLSEAAKHFDENNEYSANFYNNMGLAYFFKGNIDAALDIYDRALSIRLAIGDNESIFISNLYNDMGNGYTEKGEYEIAMDYYKNALQIRKKILGENHPETASSYNNMGIVYEALGQYDLAIKNHQKAIEIQKSIFGTDYPELANYYFGLGNVYKDQGDWDMAMDYYMQAFNIHKKNYGEMNPLVAKDLIAIGNIYTQQGENENAIDALQKALNIQRKTLGPNHPDLALTYNNIGNLYNQSGQYDLALSFYFNALDIKKTAIGEEHPEIADYYTNIGNVYAAKGDYQQALDYHQKAVHLKIMFFGKKHPALILPYLNIGNIYYEMQQYDDALKYFQLSLSVNVKDFNPDPSNIYANPNLNNYYDAKKLLNSLTGKAKTFTGRYVSDSSKTELNAAYNSYLKCDSVIDIIRRSTVSKQDKLDLGKASNKIYDQAIDVCAKLHIWFDDKSNKYLKKAFYFSEKNKAGVLLEAISAAEAQKFAGIPDSLLAIEKNLKNKIAIYETQLADVYDAEQEAEIRTKLFDVKNKYNKLIQSFEHDYPKYFEMKYSNRYASVEEIQSTLPPNTALRSYFIGESLISIFTLTRDSITLERSEKPEDFDFKIYGLRHLITSSETEDIKQFPAKSYAFYKILFPKTLPENINTLLIIQDGNLGLLPFEALLTDAYQGGIITFNNYPFLIKKYAIAYSYSANLYYKNIKRTISRSNKTNEKAWLGIAPVFNNVANYTVNDFFITPLPGTEKEVKTIDNEFIKNNLPADIRLFDAANEAFIKSEAIKKYDYLHIATHGFVNSEKPDRSGIILANNKAGGNDGVLYTGEIYNLELDADLVVLSACETGLGKVMKGEGIIGLSRALLYAGTNNIIVSLWKVSDISTSKLMIDFYDNFLKDKYNTDLRFNYAKYLQQAKLKMIKENKFGHPFFWSPFILVGN